jgi:DNA-binding MarR family transcriptional regulator
VPRKPSEPEFAARVEAAKLASVAQLLFKAARLLNERALASLPSPDAGPRLRAAHTSLFPHIDLEGTRLTELAKRLGISKQAVGQLVDELEQMGAIERVPDPDDGRAKLVRFSRKPGRTLLDGLRHLQAIEAELTHELGDARVQALREGLLALLDYLDPHMHP